MGWRIQVFMFVWFVFFLNKEVAIPAEYWLLLTNIASGKQDSKYWRLVTSSVLSREPTGLLLG